MSTDSKSLNETAIENFIKYLQIPSVHPDINYEPCVEFLKNYAFELDLPCGVHEVAPGKPVVIISWIGAKPDLKSILVNSHIDVVPVFEEKWTHKPFAAEIVNGNIYARGSQDMKCVGIQYLEAIRRLKSKSVLMKRTLHVCFVPEEEIGGIEGMGKFVQTQAFKDLNIGFAMDEGITSEDDDFVLFYGDRYGWKMFFHCIGKSGHGSFMEQNTAGERATFILDKINEFRNGEIKKLNDNKLPLSSIISINVTILKGGVQLNVLPAEFIIGVDCRITPNANQKQLEETFNQWCTEVGGVSIEFFSKESRVEPTLLDESNYFWVAARQAFDEAGIKVTPQINPATADATFLREAGLPVIGFSPINNTRLLIHDHDEYLGIETFLNGIQIYCNIFNRLCNC